MLVGGGETVFAKPVWIGAIPLPISTPKLRCCVVVCR